MTRWDYRPALRALIAKKQWSIESTAARIDCHRLALEAWLDGEANDELDEKARKFLSPTRSERKEIKHMTTVPPGFEIVRPLPDAWIRLSGDAIIGFPKPLVREWAFALFGLDASGHLFFCQAESDKVEGAVKVHANQTVNFATLVKLLGDRGFKSGTRYAADPHKGGFLVKRPQNQAE